MLIKETWREKREYNDDFHYLIIGESDLYEPYTDNIKELFQNLQREYGKCVSKIYIDDANGKAQAIGWVFEKKQKYTDCDEYYLAETWVELHEQEPDKTIKYHYHYLH